MEIEYRHEIHFNPNAQIRDQRLVKWIYEFSLNEILIVVRLEVVNRKKTGSIESIALKMY